MAAEPTTIIGNHLSPYVRKVLVCLDLEGIDYRATLCDSTVICEYLEERYPRPSLYPT